MDWQGLFTGLGNAGDILSGSESFNSIQRGNRANALAREQQAFQAHNAAANRTQEGMLQQNQFGQQTALQAQQQKFLQELETIRQINEMAKMAEQQKFLANQSGLDRTWRSSEAGLDRTSALDRTMAPLKFSLENDPMRQPIGVSEAGLFQNPSVMGMTPDRLKALGIGAIGEATIQDPMMTKAFGNTFTQTQALQAKQNLINQFAPGLGISPGIQAPSVNPFQAQRPTAVAPQQRKGNY